MRKPKRSPSAALRLFGFRQTIKGAIILGILVGSMVVAQGAAYAVTYPDTQSRTQFSTSLKSAPVLGILYGETKNLPSPAGYMVFRTVAFLALITSIWGLMASTRLLRGQEEDGRWEVIASSSTTPRQASQQIILGFGAALLIAFFLSTFIITLGGRMPDIAAPPSSGLFIGLAIFLPAIIFTGLGFFVSQLSTTRRRALLYGFTPLIFFFGLRALGNTVTDLYWLKNMTPFGWTDLINPVIDPQVTWLVPFVIGSILLFIAGNYLVAKRDIGLGVINESATSHSHYFLLGSAYQLAIRHSLPLFLSWGTISLAISALIAAIAGIAAQAVADSDVLKSSIGHFGGSADMTIAFLGAGLVLIAMVLLLMATVGIGGVRSSEAKGQLDNLLVQPLGRVNWLTSRLLIIVAASIFIALICACAIWVMAMVQEISIDLINLLFVGLTLTGVVIFVTGFGALIYGAIPRLAVIGMYSIIGWSFVVDMIASVVNLNDIIIRSSLFHYISVSPTQAPDWSTFAWLSSLGVIMAIVGVFAFTRRDIIPE